MKKANANIIKRLIKSRKNHSMEIFIVFFDKNVFMKTINSIYSNCCPRKKIISKTTRYI